MSIQSIHDDYLGNMALTFKTSQTADVSNVAYIGQCGTIKWIKASTSTLQSFVKIFPKGSHVLYAESPNPKIMTCSVTDGSNLFSYEFAGLPNTYFTNRKSSVVIDDNDVLFAAMHNDDGAT